MNQTVAKPNHDRIGIVGGTGALGSSLAALAARRGYDVFIGSRVKARGAETASTLMKALNKQALTAKDARAKSVSTAGTIQGGRNQTAAQWADIVILSVPGRSHESLIRPLADALREKVVVDTTVSLDPSDPTRLAPPDEGSSALKVESLVDAGTRVVAGFHTVAAETLRQLASGAVDEHELGDVFLCGEAAAVKAVQQFAQTLGLRAFHTGPLSRSGTLERLTPMIIDLNQRYRRKAISLRLTGVEP